MKFKSNSFRTIWSSLLIGFILIPLTGWAQTPIPIQCGQTVMGSFSTPDQKNSYSFSGTAGDSISIFVKEPGSNTFTPTIRLVSPGEEEIGFGWGDLHATLPASGVYRVEVTFSLAEAGSYFLVWQRWNNPCGTSIVNCGQVVKASIGGTVDAPPWRFYSLEGLAGDRMTIFAYGGDGSGQAEIQVKDSQGNSMGFFYEKFDITLPTSGTYHFWIMSMTDQGDYSVTWQRWNNPCNATPLSCGQTLSGSLIVAGQHNFYTFTATGGDTINIHLARTSGTMIPYIQLIDSTGTQIDLGIGYVGSVDIEKMLPTGGTYIIEVSDDGDQRVGGYKLKVQRNNNSCPEVVLTAPNGSEILKSGSNFMITWTSTNPGTISSQEIRLSKDGGLTFPTLIATDLPGNAQSFDWTLSTDMATPRGRIRVTINSASGSVYDDSDADFAILQYAPRVSRTYVYDKVNQLIQVIYEDGSSIHYSYDAVGNRIASTGASQSEGVISVTPSEGLSSSGNLGGPFSPSTKDYTLKNTGGNSIDYTVNKNQPWITLSGTSGSIAAGASTTITVSINSNANAFTDGSYTDSVSFTNTTNGIGNTSRNVSLTVNTISETITTPTTPSGPTSGNTGTSYAYSTGGSSSSFGHNIQYLFDWRDGTDSGWLPVGQTSASHMWPVAGTYHVRAQARCSKDTTILSAWSTPFSVIISGPPVTETVSTPSTPSGPTSGITGTSYSYSTGGSTSNLNHSIQYFFDWGDGTNSGWLPAGTTSASHCWNSSGTYLIKVQAACSSHSSIVSAWSGTLSISISSIPIAPIALQSPASGAVFNTCSLITNHQPSFQWTASEPFTQYGVFFSTSPSDFPTPIAKATVKGTQNSSTPSSSIWKKIMTSSYNAGNIQDIYWKIVGTKADKTTEASEVRSFRIGTPQAVIIDAPLNSSVFPSKTPPTFDFSTNCNTKFKLEISSLNNFSDSSKVKSFNFTSKDPNVETSLHKTLTTSQWSSVKKLVGTGTGYFRIWAWDGLSRESVSEGRGFTVQ